MCMSFHARLSDKVELGFWIFRYICALGLLVLGLLGWGLPNHRDPAYLQLNDDEVILFLEYCMI